MAPPPEEPAAPATPPVAPAPATPPVAPGLAARAELEAGLLRRLRGTRATIPVVPRPQGVARFPASPAQEWAWTRTRARPRPAPVVLAGMRLRGPLDTTALEQALNAVLARHEILRTVLREAEDGRLTQVVSPALRLRIPVTDGTLADFDALTRAEVDQLPGLAHGPLVRARLLRLDAEDHIVIVVLHHMVADARATEILLADLAAAYLAARAGRPAAPPPPPLQYADHAVWQRDRTSDAHRSRRTGYWTRRLAGALPPSLPSDRPHPDLPAELGDAVVLPLPGGLPAALRACVREHGTTVFVGALTAFQVLLARYTGSRDISVPAPVTFRDLRELEDMIGDFSHPMVCRTDLSGSPTFASLLPQVRDAFAQDLQHADLPPHLLTPNLAGPDELSDLLDGLEFGAERAADAQELGGGLSATPMPPRWPYALRPLSVRLSHRPDGGDLVLTYRRRDFSPGRARDLGRDYLSVLAACLDSPGAEVFGPLAPGLRVPPSSG
ncbi:condensation domain-containing protein [Streptomyces sp. 1-11]|uniref:condensation domain-containing protein n=1 Tax=Streptomyces sp. 1-11 TaxID=2590549 RepID=UPI0011675158|nr:condensation domain-containing protein [Streptomyces sp. 1-11]GEK01128.1 peptide synthetase [Streptomyces sp. 1-11]